MKNRKLKGFTLIELIVVIAIIGVLAGILVPSLIGYVNKAKRRTDASNAKVIHDDFQLILYTDDSKYSGWHHYGSQQDMTPMESFIRIAGGSTGRTSKGINAGTRVHVNAGTDKEETYNVYVVCYMDGWYEGQSKFMTWNRSDLEATSLTVAMQKFYGLPDEGSSRMKKSGIPIQSRSYKGNRTNRWYIVYRTDDVSKIEVWVGDGTTGYAGTPLYRLYPECCDEYK